MQKSTGGERLEFEDWVKLGAYLKKARTLIFMGHRLDSRPKTRKRDWERVIKRIDEARNLLDNLFIEEHKDRESDVLVNVFYGEKDREP